MTLSRICQFLAVGLSLASTSCCTFPSPPPQAELMARRILCQVRYKKLDGTMIVPIDGLAEGMLETWPVLPLERAILAVAKQTRQEEGDDAVATLLQEFAGCLGAKSVAYLKSLDVQHLSFGMKLARTSLLQVARERLELIDMASIVKSDALSVTEQTILRQLQETAAAEVLEVSITGLKEIDFPANVPAPDFRVVWLSIALQDGREMRLSCHYLSDIGLEQDSVSVGLVGGTRTFVYHLRLPAADQ